MNIESYRISVYPTSKRDDRFDRNARLNSEQNLISTVNRLTNTDAFVIDGLEIYSTNNELYITSGSCNIHGYYFTINDHDGSKIIKNSPTAVKISEFNKAAYHGATLYFEILTKQVDATASNNNMISFTELIGNDIVSGTQTVYNGLSIVAVTNENKANYDPDKYGKQDDNGNYRYFLPIAVFAEVSDGVFEWHTAPNRTLKYNAEDIKVDFTGEDKTPIIGNTMATAYAMETNLAYWLRANYIIDDGSLD